MKVITSQLTLWYKYRWIGPARLQVIYKGAELHAVDLESEMVFLNYLGLPFWQKCPKKQKNSIWNFIVKSDLKFIIKEHVV